MIRNESKAWRLLAERVAALRSPAQLEHPYLCTAINGSLGEVKGFRAQVAEKTRIAMVARIREDLGGSGNAAQYTRSSDDIGEEYWCRTTLARDWRVLTCLMFAAESADPIDPPVYVTLALLGALEACEDARITFENMFGDGAPLIRETVEKAMSGGLGLGWLWDALGIERANTCGNPCCTVAGCAISVDEWIVAVSEALSKR